MQRDEAYIGQYVNIAGYGGFAKILAIVEQDQLSPAGTLMYRITIEWGATNSHETNNGCIGKAKAASPIEEYPLGRASATTDGDQMAHEDQMDTIENANEQQLLAMLAQLKAGINA